MNKNLTKKKIAESINKKLGYSKEESKDFIKTFFSLIIKNIVNEKKVKISKLGTFKLVKKSRRIGRNPKNGKEAIISERNVISFRISRLIKEKMNK